MIANEAELEQTRQNLAGVEAAIESLRKELMPDHETNFRVYAQPWLDFKAQFEADIQAYLRQSEASSNGVPPRAEAADTKSLELT